MVDGRPWHSSDDHRHSLYQPCSSRLKDALLIMSVGRVLVSFTEALNHRASPYGWEGNRRSSGTTVCCLVTEARGCEQLA